MTRLRSGATKEEEIGELNPHDRIKTKSLILFIAGLFFFVGVIFWVGYDNQRMRITANKEEAISLISKSQKQLSVEIAKFHGVLNKQLDLIKVFEDKLMSVEQIEIKELGIMNQIILEQNKISDEISKQQGTLEKMHDHIEIINKQNSTPK